MLYLLDTNALIEAKNLYYPIDRVPHFWAWVVDHARTGRIKLPTKVIEEILRGRKEDELLTWVKNNRPMLDLGEEIDEQEWSLTLTKGYGFTTISVAEEKLVEHRADPFLIAHALSDANSRCVVTLERAKAEPNNLPNPINRKIPTVCDLLGLKHMDTFELIRELDFRIPLS